MADSAGVKNKEFLFKVIVIGHPEAGKTSIMRKYVHQAFSSKYKATFGADFFLKVLKWDNNTTIRVQFWDIAGQEYSPNMTGTYYRNAVGCFIVFDLTNEKSFQAVTDWKTDLDSKVFLKDGSKLPCVLLGNKCDLEKYGLFKVPEQMETFCKEHGFIKYFKTSAKEDINIDAAAKYLISKILERANQETESESEEGGDPPINMANDIPPQTQGGFRCCK